tara:strand:+ start:31451 stop:31654 length:204 start_codon:yes stop_codon:yes gene_type:complete
VIGLKNLNNWVTEQKMSRLKYACGINFYLNIRNVFYQSELVKDISGRAHRQAQRDTENSIKFILQNL